jgi:hypothetical protein
MRKCLAAVALLVTFTGCGGRIPNHVTTDEYGVYAEWMKAHFSTNPPNNLYVDSRTFVFDPLSSGCANAIHGKAGVPWALIKQLHALGEAEYWLPDAYSSTRLSIPWSYRLVDGLPLISQESGPYRLVGFSRVAFDTTNSKAFFAVSDACGGLCGGGGAVYAHKQNNAWVFKSGGCDWMY